jgi:hypothetical protein
MIPIPNDPLKRCWIDVSAKNPDLVDMFRPTLLAFLTRNKSNTFEIAGSGFIISVANQFAFAFTAKHVLIDGTKRIQTPVPIHAASSLFITSKATIPNFNRGKVKALYMNSQTADLLQVIDANFNDSLDIALCIVTANEPTESKIEPLAIPIQPIKPRVGEVIHLVSLAGLRVEEITPPSDETGKGQHFTLARSVNIRIGTVTAYYPGGDRQYKWPCFTTSIPAEPGMSGGFAYIPKDGAPIAACGVICADRSDADAQHNCYKSGESVIGCTWPALALRAPTLLPRPSGKIDLTLHELIRRGIWPMPPSGIDHIDLVDDLIENGVDHVGIRLMESQI